MQIRRHIYFSGMVQGVGFRYRSSYLAQSLGLTGWVKNLWDNRVEMEIQGEKKDIEAFLDRLQSQRFISIDGMDMAEIPCQKESQFKIVY